MFTVHITNAAARDIEATLEYLLAQQEDAVATTLWEAFEKCFVSLETLPLRGHLPPELWGYPDKHIREVHVGSYRVIYRVYEKEVYILFIADGRRDIQQTLLERALRFGI